MAAKLQSHPALEPARGVPSPRLLGAVDVAPARRARRWISDARALPGPHGRRRSADICGVAETGSTHDRGAASAVTNDDAGIDGGPYTLMDVWFVLPPDLVLLDFAGPADAFRIARQLGAPFRVRIAAAEAQATTSLGITLGRVEALPKSLDSDALLVVCGASNDLASLASRPGRKLVHWLRETGHQPSRLACVCAGALFAARAGLLDGRRCTSHHSEIELLRKEAPGAHVLDSRVFVEDRGCYTSAGITAGIDLALHLIAELASAQLSAEVARHMVVYLRRAPDDPALSPWLQSRNHMDADVHRAQDVLIRAAHEDWPLPRLAARAHVSVRTLTRHFREATGTSVRDYHAGLRFALARQALQSGMSVESAATAAGLGSARQLRRLWAQCAGTTPGRDRAAAGSMASAAGATRPGRPHRLQP